MCGVQSPHSGCQGVVPLAWAYLGSPLSTRISCAWKKSRSIFKGEICCLAQQGRKRRILCRPRRTAVRIKDITVSLGKDDPCSIGAGRLALLYTSMHQPLGTLGRFRQQQKQHMLPTCSYLLGQGMDGTHTSCELMNRIGGDR